MIQRQASVGQLCLAPPHAWLKPSTMSTRNAQVLAHYARHRASDTKFASPFSYAAYQAGIRYMGGKLDDITILVAYVERVAPQQPASKL